MQLLLFLLGFLLFIGLILAHEWGHFITARKNGVKVEEFGLGIPPRAWSRKLKSGMILSLNWLPLGGFVKLKGEHDADSEPGSFGAASLKAKTKILLAGVSMNVLVGLVILTVLAFIGIPKIITPQTVGEEQFSVKRDAKVIQREVLAGFISPGSPAQQIGLRSNDVILKIASGGQEKTIKNTQQLHDATQAFGGQKIALTFKRGSKAITKSVQLRSPSEVEKSLKTADPKGYLGVSPNEFEVMRSTWSAPVVAVGFSAQLFKLTFQGLWHALSGLGSIIAGISTGNHQARQNGQSLATSQVGGPVAIMEVLWGGGTLGFRFMLIIVAVISLTLALMNVLPIPALDGGRLFVILFSRLLRIRISPRAEELIHGMGMAFLLTLFVLITIVDVHRFF